MPDCNINRFKELFETNKSFGFFSRFFSKSKAIDSFCSMCRLTINDEKSRADHQKMCKKLHIVLFSIFAATSNINQLKILANHDTKNEMNFYVKFKAKLEKKLLKEDLKWRRKYSLPVHKSLSITLDYFEFIKPLTKGGYGQLFLLKDKITGKNMTAKIISISEAIQRSCIGSYLAERDILLKCKSEFIVTLFYSFRSEFFIYQVNFNKYDKIITILDYGIYTKRRS